MWYKKHLISSSFLILSSICLVVKANLVVIECNFPCADSADVCEVTDSYVQCKPRTDTTKWVLKDTMSLPAYQGSLILLGQPCITAPHPTLKDASHLSKNTSETCLEWPQSSAYDSYYSNCASDLYCDRAHICVKQLAHGEVCESDNQCLDGICSNHTCVEEVKKSTSRGSNTVHIIASIVGVVIFIIVVVCIYLYRRRQLLKKRATKQQSLDKEQSAALPKPTTNTSRSNSSSSDTTATTTTSTTSSATLHNSNHPSINMLHPAYDSHFQQDSSRTPSMQQQQLQYQLQRQILFNKTNNSSAQDSPDGSSSVAPPPYSP